MRYIAYGNGTCSSNEKTTTEPKPKQEEKVQEKPKVQTIQKQQKDSYVVSEDELSKAAQSIGEIQNEQTINDMMIHMSLQNSHSMGIIFMFPVPVM